MVKGNRIEISKEKRRDNIMRRKVLAILLSSILALQCTGCGTTYQEATNMSDSSDSFAKGYFTIITEWGGTPTYRIVYANDTKVKYFIFFDGYRGGISPLYNSDGTLQVYGE